MKTIFINIVDSKARVAVGQAVVGLQHLVLAEELLLRGPGLLQRTAQPGRELLRPEGAA